MRIALVQMHVESGFKERNVEHGIYLMDEAAANSDLVVLPELWTIGYDFRNIDEQAVRMNDGLPERISRLARHHGVTIVAGTVPFFSEGKIRNTSLIFSPDGHLIDMYSKRHLFQGYLEARVMEPGNHLSCYKAGNIFCGMAVCFELYFPKMFRKMSKKGVTLATIPALWPEPHIHHWRILAKARAIENGMYIAAVNAVGEYHGVVFGGRSMLVDPEGYSQVEGDMEEHIYYGNYEEEKYRDLARTQAVIHLDKPDHELW